MTSTPDLATEVPTATPTADTPTPAAALDAAIRAAIEAAIATPTDSSPYVALPDGHARKRVRDAIETRSRSALARATDMEGFQEARRLAGVVATLESLKSPRGSSVGTPDPAVVIANRVATLRLAADMLESGMVAPDGHEAIDLDGHTRDLVTAVDYASAMTLASAKVTRSAPTHKVEDGLRIAFDGEPYGTVLTVAQIRTRWAAAGGPAKSDGRIAARLFAESGCTIDWVVPADATSDRAKGARLVAEVPPATPAD